MPIYPVQYTDMPVAPSPAFPSGRIALRPALPVAIVAGASRLSCFAIVDSGADHCVFPRVFLQQLGLDPLQAPAELNAGVGGTTSTHFFNVTLDFGGGVQVQVFAGFTSGLDAIGFGLLGQSGFFDRFNVYFKQSQHIYEVEPI